MRWAIPLLLAIAGTGPAFGADVAERGAPYPSRRLYVRPLPPPDEDRLFTPADGTIPYIPPLIGTPFLRRSGPYLIAGFGEVGRKVHELLTDAGEEVRVVERQNAAGVDIVGNVLDSSVLQRAALHECRAVVLALNSDDATLFATVIARDAAPDVPVIARVNHSRNIDNIYRAGADFALSISDISGEMLSSRLLGRVARSRDEHRRVERFTARSTRALRDLGLRQQGCSLLAIERNGAFVPATADAIIEPGDQLYVCGAADAVRGVNLSA